MCMCLPPSWKEENFRFHKLLVNSCKISKKGRIDSKTYLLVCKHLSWDFLRMSNSSDHERIANFLHATTSIQRIQHFKEVSQTDQVQKFPLTAVWTSRYTSVFIYACCVINFNTLWLGVHQYKISQILTYSQFCKTSKKMQPAKQDLLSLIPEAAVHINFAVNLARFFRTPLLYYIDNHIQNRCSKKSRKVHGKTPLMESLLIKLQVSGLQFY